MRVKTRPAFLSHFGARFPCLWLVENHADGRMNRVRCRRQPGKLGHDQNRLHEPRNRDDALASPAVAGHTRASGRPDAQRRSIFQIADAPQPMCRNSEIDHAAIQAFIAGVSARLDDNFLRQALQNELHMDFVKQGGSFGIQPIGKIMAAAMKGAALGPLFSGMTRRNSARPQRRFLAGGLGNVMASAALAAMTGSTLTQVRYGASLDFGAVIKTGLSAEVTTALLNRIAYSSADGLGCSTTASSNRLSSLADVRPTFVDDAVGQAGATPVGLSVAHGVAILGQSVIHAGVQSAIQVGRSP